MEFLWIALVAAAAAIVGIRTVVRGFREQQRRISMVESLTRGGSEAPNA
jgi:hypothetical protein